MNKEAGKNTIKGILSIEKKYIPRPLLLHFPIIKKPSEKILSHIVNEQNRP